MRGFPLTGLVLEGGAMRGMFTCGVTDVLSEAGVSFDGMVGVSAGAAYGCNVKSGQPGRAYRYNRRYCRDPRFCGARSLLTTGDIFGVDFCYREIPLHLDPFDLDAFEKNPMAFYVVCTDADTGEPLYHRCDTLRGSEMTYLRASASMPLVSRVVEVDGLHLLDGGVADGVPLSYFESIGYARNLVVLTRPRGYRKGSARFLGAAKLSLRRYPAMVEAMRTRPARYNATLEEIERREREDPSSLFVLRPPRELPIHRLEHDPEKIDEAYRIGRETAAEALPRLRAFLLEK